MILFNYMSISTKVNNMGIKHDFLCINICSAPRAMLLSEVEGKGFSRSEGHSRCKCFRINTFDRYYCIKLFWCLTTVNKPLRKFEFLKYTNSAQKHERCVCSINASSRYPDVIKVYSLFSGLC